MEKNTIIVNFFAGPGAGKSTGAAWVFAKLKADGVDAELVTEFAKDKVWEQNKEVFKCQFYITGKQSFKISRCFGKVDVIITDSPIALGAIYADTEGLKQASLEEFNKYKSNNLNVFIERKKKYNPNGRNQTEAEAKELDKSAKNFLDSNNIPFMSIHGNAEGYDKLVEIIKEKITK